ncbi:hypothetical protein N2599_13935 [Rhizobium sullae]|uniref:Curli production assembly/transport component CsgE n=1 Tax=Rhizobium sullae TaxID=50338 RepID=A0ABY5XF88_RHISU|nr:hypothetical protein [Rhizobium sullae]UWU13244.1 hypothetical protein N2599_13935 [Rhizobium sullae]
MVNPYSEEERLQAMMAAVFGSVRQHFSHLAVRDVIDPPHRWFDAALARQIATYILVVEFDIPRRRVAMMQMRGRTQILMAVRTVDERLQDPPFKRAYDQMAARAKDMLMQEIKRAAA